MAERIIAVSINPFDRAIEKIGDNMLRCAHHRNGKRCMHPLCPKDQVRPSKRNYEMVAEMIAAVPKGMRTTMITLTTGVDSIRKGHPTFVDVFARLRRRKSCSAIVAGYGQIEVLPTNGKRRCWNLHAHVLVLHKGPLKFRAIRQDWKRLLNTRGLPGSLWETRIPVARRTVASRHGGHVLAGGRVHHEAATGEGLARVQRRPPSRAGTRLRGASLGRAFRIVDQELNNE